MKSITDHPAALFGRLRSFRSALDMPRAMLLALAFAALGVVLLRPLCELGFAGDVHSAVAGFATAGERTIGGHPDRGDTPSVACCDSVKDGTVAKPAELLASWTRGGAPGAALLLSAGLLLFARPRDTARLSLADLPERSFHARSARILR